MTYRVIGPPAIGEAFFNRKCIIERIIKILTTGSVMLIAPRRFGKTSVMLAVRDCLTANGSLALYLDVEWISNPCDFITEVVYRLNEAREKGITDLIKSLPKGLLDSVKAQIETIEIPVFRLKMREELKDEWEEKGREILKIIKKQNHDTILIIDELPLMLHNMIKKGIEVTKLWEFLYWLRCMRVEWGIKIIAGGSIGIDHILTDLKATASFNDLERVFVGPFSREEAREFIVLAFKAEGIAIKEDCIETFLSILGEAIPYFLQILISSAIDEVRFLKKTELSSEMINRVYLKRILGVEFRPYFEHYFQRLSVYYSPEDAKIAKLLLKKLAVEKEMKAKELFDVYSKATDQEDGELFKTLIDDLQNDFYIIYDEDAQVYRFATGVLRDLWLRRYEVLD